MKKNIELSLQKAREIYGKSKEMDELLLANFTKEELTKPVLPKRWEDLGYVNGFYLIGIDTSYTKDVPTGIYDRNQNVFKTFKQAKSALAKAQLSQLMAVYNDGWEADWGDGNKKWTIIRWENEIKTEHTYGFYYFLAFKSKEIRDEFLKNFEDLIKIYFEL